MIITRTQFQAAIEKGIADSPALTADERSALRLVGLSAQNVGRCFRDTPGCPLTMAGLFDPNEKPGLGESGSVQYERRAKFYRGYDDAMFAMHSTFGPFEVR